MRYDPSGGGGAVGVVGGGLLLTTKTILLTSTISTFVCMGGRDGPVSRLFGTGIRTLANDRDDRKKYTAHVYNGYRVRRAT